MDKRPLLKNELAEEDLRALEAAACMCMTHGRLLGMIW
jgi:hypothetical protein